MIMYFNLSMSLCLTELDSSFDHYHEHGETTMKFPSPSKTTRR